MVLTQESRAYGVCGGCVRAVSLPCRLPGRDWARAAKQPAEHTRGQRVGGCGGGSTVGGVFGRLSDKPSKRALEPRASVSRVAPHHELIIFAPSSDATGDKKLRKIGPPLTHGGRGRGSKQKQHTPNPLKQISIETPLGYSCTCDWLVSLSRRPANNKSWARRSLHLSHECAQGTTHAHPGGTALRDLCPQWEQT